jgi:hypothetical protein
MERIGLTFHVHSMEPIVTTTRQDFTPLASHTLPTTMSKMNHTNTVKAGEILKFEAGLWVDHREALIVVLTQPGEKTTRIQSNAEKQLRRAGEPSVGRFEYQEVPADDSRQRAYSGYLARYYDEIIACLRDAGAILIFGPGEAKGELKKRFEKERPALTSSRWKRPIR